MNEELKSLYLEFVNMSNDERLQAAEEGARDVLKWVKGQGLSDEDTIYFLTGAIKLFVASDGEVSKEEWILFNQLFDSTISFDNFVDYISRIDEDYFVSFNKLIDAMDVSAKSSLCLVGLAFLSADDKLTAEELAIFEEVLY